MRPVPQTPRTLVPSRAILLAAILLAHLPLPVQAQTSALSQSEIVQVHGVVVNAVTRAPIPRALVTSGDQHMALLTDGEGRFTIAVKPPLGDARDPTGLGPTIFLMARRPGFQPMNRPTILSLTDPAALAATLQLKLMPQSAIVGRIQAPGIDAPQNVNVQLVYHRVQDGTASWQPGQTTQTDIHGEYRFADLAPGDYRLVTLEWMERIGPAISIPGRQTIGYPPYAYPEPTIDASAIHITGGETIHADLTLHPEPYHSVSFPIANYGTPNGTTISVRNQAGLTFSLGIDQRTQSVQGTLPDGLYHVTVAVFGQPTEPNTMPPMSYAEVDFAVAGKPLRGPSLTLAPGATIPVNVRQEFTAADPNQQVANPQQGFVSMLRMQMRSVDVSLQPKDSDGNFVGLANPKPDSSGPDSLFLEGVRPGTYRVAVNAHRGYAASVTADGVDLLRYPLVVAPGGAIPTIQIVLRDDTAAVTGTVTQPSARRGTPSFINVSAFPYGAEAGLSNLVQSSGSQDGSFTMPNLPPGKYLLLAGTEFPLNLEYRNEEAMKPYVAKGTIVTLGPGQTASVALTATAFDQQFELDEGQD